MALRYKTAIPISEIFGPVIQGEGPLLGHPTIFVRTGGCDYQHCSWCDTLYAVLPVHKPDWTPMEPEVIMAEVLGLSKGQPCHITLSGGNPAIHRQLGAFIEMAHANRCQVSIETQGSIPQPWFASLDQLVLSPKPPSSHMKTDFAKLRECVEAGKGAPTYLKIVVFDENDYQYARNVSRMFPRLPIYLQVGNHTPPQVGAVDVMGLLDRLRWLCERATADQWWNAIVTPQLHTLLYGNTRGT